MEDSELAIPSCPDQEQPIVVAAVIMVRLGASGPEILLARRYPQPGSADDRPEYTLPGGKQFPDENVRITATRELREETGWQVHPENVVQAHRFPFRIQSSKGLLTIYTYFAYWDESTGEMPPQNLEPEKHANWEWIPIKDVYRLWIDGEFPLQLIPGWWIDILNEFVDFPRPLYPAQSYIIED